MYELYEKFIEKKVKVYLTEKKQLHPGDKFYANTQKQLQRVHMQYARSIILKKNLTISDEDMTEAIDLGIIVKSQSGFDFLHRTFAEFLTAKYLLDEYFLNKEVSVVDKMAKGQLVKILHGKDLNYVRKFINRKFNHEQMITEFTKPEVGSAIQNMLNKKWQEIIQNSVIDENLAILEFLLDLCWHFYPIEMTSWREGGQPHFNLDRLLVSAFISSKSLGVILDWMIKNWQGQRTGILIEIFKYLLESVLVTKDRKTSNCKELIESVIDYQKKLVQGQMLDDDNLVNILLALQPNEDSPNYNEWTYWNPQSIKYLAYLKKEHEKLFHIFFKAKRDIIQNIIEFNDDCGELYQMFYEEIDPNLIFDYFVDGVGDSVVVDRSDNKLKSYLAFLQNYVRDCDQLRKDKFREFLEKSINRDATTIFLSEEILTEIVINYRKFISLDNIMSNLKSHTRLSLIENCALWGRKQLLKEILREGDIEAEVVNRLQLQLHETIPVKIKHILNDIKASGNLQEIAEVRVSVPGNADRHSVLTFAIAHKDQLNIDIFASWITSEELFVSLHNTTTVNDELIEFVDNKFPQFRVKYFEINKSDFISKSSTSEIIFEIFADNTKINSSDFIKLLQLQNDEGETILHNAIMSVDVLQKWLGFVQNKCAKESTDIVDSFEIRDKNGCTVLESLRKVNNTNQREEIIKILFKFFMHMNLISLKGKLKTIIYDFQ